MKITGKEKAAVALLFGILGAISGVIQPYVANHTQLNAANWIELATTLLSAVAVYVVPNSSVKDNIKQRGDE
jgi:uncharacterized membrane protein HdeD (DUF308 family)